MKGPTVLVVDDAPDHLGVVLESLHSAGLRVLAAIDGTHATELLAAQPIDLVLLDASKPERDGFATLVRIRRRSEWAEIPVLLMLRGEDAEQKIRAFESGAADYIGLPVCPPELLQRVRTFLDLRAARRQLHQPGGVGSEIASRG